MPFGCWQSERFETVTYPCWSRPWRRLEVRLLGGHLFSHRHLVSALGSLLGFAASGSGRRVVIGVTADRERRTHHAEPQMTHEILVFSKQPSGLRRERRYASRQVVDDTVIDAGGRLEGPVVDILTDRTHRAIAEGKVDDTTVPAAELPGVPG